MSGASALKFRPSFILVYLAFMILLIYVFAPYIWLITASLSVGANLSVKLPERPTLVTFA